MTANKISKFSACIFVFIVLHLIPIPTLQAQPAAPRATKAVSPSLFGFFHNQLDSLPLLEIDTDWGQLIRTKRAEAYQPGILRFKGQDGNSVKLKVQLRARGNTRKKVCLFPPLKVKPEKQQMKALGFNPEHKLKLVLPCQPGNAHEDCLLREALAYQLYEMIYPIHFRTRIVRLQCRQENKEKHMLYAFLIEEDEELAVRLNGRRLLQGRINAAALDQDIYGKMCFFQYMIANTDWSIASRHNLKFMQLPGYNRVVVVPYDFDYAGLVNTTYAIPGSTIPIDDVSERYFLGEGITQQEALKYSDFFLSRKAQVLEHCRSFDLLKEKSKDAVQVFLSDFFKILENEELVLKTFVKRNTGY